MNYLPQRTPVAPFVGKTIKPRIGLTPILRAGLGMTDALVFIMPIALNSYPVLNTCFS